MTKLATNVVYLDYNATAPLLPAVKQAMISAFDLVGNASAVHQLGRKCRAEIDSEDILLFDRGKGSKTLLPTSL